MPYNSEVCHVHLEDSQKSVTPVQIIWVEHIKLNGFSLFISPSGQMCARIRQLISRNA